MYIAPGQGKTNPWGLNFDVNRKVLSFWPSAAGFKKDHFEVWFYTCFLMCSCMYIALAQEQTTHWWQNLDVNRKPRSLWPFFYKFQNNLFEFWFYTHYLIILHTYIAPGQGQTNPWGQNFDVNRKLLTLWPFVASFKNISLILILYTFFNVFPHVYSPGAGTDNPLWTKFWCQH